MAQIRIDTEHVRDVGRRLIAEGDRLNEIGQELHDAIGSLDTGAWDGHSRAQAGPLLGRVQPESARVSEGLDELGRMLVRVADAFEQEDNTAARNLEGMPWVDFESKGPMQPGSVDTAPAPTEASLLYVLDDRNSLVRFLSAIPVLNLLFPPLVGGDLSVDEQLRRLFGRDVNLVDGDEQWSEKEVALVRDILDDLPPDLANRSVLSHIYRDAEPDDKKLLGGVFCPVGDSVCPHARSIVIYDAAYGEGFQKRYGVDADTAFQAVLTHELVHTAQYNEAGLPNDLLRKYADEMGWKEAPGTGWLYEGDPKALPGSDQPQYMYPNLEENGPSEDFAEAVTFYMYAPERLSQERYDFVREHIFGGREFK